MEKEERIIELLKELKKKASLASLGSISVKAA
jgi:hypothetical protein